MALTGSSRRRRVLFLPGYGADDGSTMALRTSIAAHGHHVHRWKAGRNRGPDPETVTALEGRLRELSTRHRTEVALVGWSLGGVYAWALAARYPDLVQQVITLGSPLRTNSTGLAPLSVPATSIWSRRDRIVPWQASVVDGEQTENIEVGSGHLALGFDPFVIHAVANRLQEDARQWQPFRPPAWLHHGYPVSNLRP